MRFKIVCCFKCNKFITEGIVELKDISYCSYCGSTQISRGYLDLPEVLNGG